MKSGAGTNVSIARRLMSSGSDGPAVDPAAAKGCNVQAVISQDENTPSRDLQCNTWVDSPRNAMAKGY